MTPLRIQRKRTKGYRLPPNTKCVTRPGDYGNPWRAVKRGKEWIVVGEDGQQQGTWVYPTQAEAVEATIRLYEMYANHRSEYTNWLVELNGKNLACFCPLCPAHKDGKPFGVVCPHCAPCHSDPLGCMANGIEVNQ